MSTTHTHRPDNQPPVLPGKASTTAAGGFTLVELLVVIIIIALVISIVVPTLGKARRATRVTVTKQLATNVVNAASTFQAAQRRWPGKFSPKDMGGSENLTLGLSAMENVMLDLAGGIVAEGDTGTTINKGAIKVAPFTTATRKSEFVYVDPGLIGNTNAGNATSAGYFSPPAKNFVSQVNNGTSEIKQSGKYGDESASTKTLPDLVDEFGTPILVWCEDETAGPVKFDSGTTGPNTFARKDSGDVNKPAHFYWGSNAAFLNSNSLGKVRTNQVRRADGSAFSLLGGTGGSPNDAVAASVDSLTGVLGNPGFAANVPSASIKPESILPSGSRGRFVVHCADADGYYFSSKSKGNGEIDKSIMYFGYNYALPGGTARKDDKNQQTNIDITAKFDDILVSSGS